MNIKQLREHYEGTATGDDIDAVMAAAKASNLAAVNAILARHTGKGTLEAVAYAAKMAFPRRATTTQATQSTQAATSDDLENLQALVACLGDLAAVV